MPVKDTVNVAEIEGLDLCDDVTVEEGVAL